MKKYWFVFCKDSLMLERLSDGSFSIPYQEDPPVEVKEWTTIHNISPLLSLSNGTEIPVKTFCIDQPIIGNPRYEMCGLRASFYKISHLFYQKAGKCQEILYWDANTHYCGVCGAPMKMHTDISKRCTQCGKEVWPQLATAIIVLIHRPAPDGDGEEVLLVHAKNFRTDFFGLVAGFVETGETLEEAVEREVHEEVGIRIKNIHYWSSQPWPYPCGLMVGFYAEYDGGMVHLQRSELSAGGWFKKSNLPRIPEKLSIARQLIDHWINFGD